MRRASDMQKCSLTARWGVALAAVGLEDVGGREALTVHQEQAPNVGRRPVQVHQQLVLQAGHRHAQLAVPHRQRHVLSFGNALVELLQRDLAQRGLARRRCRPLKAWRSAGPSGRRAPRARSWRPRGLFDPDVQGAHHGGGLRPSSTAGGLSRRTGSWPFSMARHQVHSHALSPFSVVNAQGPRLAALVHAGPQRGGGWRKYFGVSEPVLLRRVITAEFQFFRNDEGIFGVSSRILECRDHQ
jgi:hypothetical protein